MLTESGPAGTEDWAWSAGGADGVLAVELEGQGHGADARARFGDGHAHLDRVFAAAGVEGGLLDERILAADERPLPFRLVALPVVGRLDHAADERPPVVHDEGLDHEWV